ncbi:AlkA N-terminal domain-containing protein [Abyssibacter sp.]|uniref:AlkA N-terminal domain-containing protein n=1 Tax=Abyssibacter sp. TaxID=2320200 RepID=UPI0035163C7D
MTLEPDICYAAMQARDSRFDGEFFVGVSSTGIFCRPVCTVRLPHRDRCTYYANAASAEAAGYRPCLRCRPELAPGSSRVDAVSRTAARVFARIDAGALTDDSLDALAAEFDLSARQLRRVVEQEYGVSPVQLAQTRRLLLAKQLIADTQLPMADVAFAAGFSSVRRFNHLFRSRYGMNPTAMRRGTAAAEAGRVVLKLGYRPPLHWEGLAGFLSSRGATVVERVDRGVYRRTVQVGETTGWLQAEPDTGKHQLRLTVSESLVPMLRHLLAGVRHLFDLNASPAAIDAYLGQDALMAGFVQRAPGLRIPGALDGFEVALRAILGQQISVKAATTVFGRFAQTFGRPVDTPWPELSRAAPTAEVLAQAPLQQIIDQGMTQRRAQTVQTLARCVADGEIVLTPSADVAATQVALLALPGIGPWTVQYLTMRALGQPDALPASDLGLMRAAACDKPAELLARAEAWRPWRSYAAMHLWQSLTRPD